MKQKNLPIILSPLFVIAEILLAILVQTTTGDINRYISYASIVLACVYFLSFAEWSWEYATTQIAFVTTLVADYFLVLLVDMKQIPAMIFFSLTQLMYFIRLYTSTESRKIRMIHIVFRLTLIILSICLTVRVLEGSADMLSLISMFYFANLVSNIVFAILQFRNNYLFALGLLLFACCDVLIGFSFLGNYLAITPGSFADKLANPGCNLAWAFYVPSQTLIALSLLPQRIKKTKNSCDRKT